MGNDLFGKYRCETCQFELIADDILADSLSALLRIEPDLYIEPNMPQRRAIWRLSSNVQSDDVNVHLRWLPSILLPHKDRVLAAATEPYVAFTIVPARDQAPYRSGVGIAADCIQGIAAFGAALHVPERIDMA